MKALLNIQNTENRVQGIRFALIFGVVIVTIAILAIAGVIDLSHLNKY